MILLDNKFMSALRSYRMKSFQHKYWKSILKIMERQNGEFYDNTIEPMLPFINKPGIALSFDDSFRVNHWYTYGKDIFGYYDVKVTFNINTFHHFENQREHSQKEIDMLLELQSNGHEIAHHGFKHTRAANYSNEFGISRWVEEDILPLINWMEEQSHSRTNEKFKKPVTYAFPFFNYNNDNIKELVPKYFKIIRGHLYGDNLTAFNYTGFAPSICIDNNKLSDVKYIIKMLKVAKQTGRNIILTCHSILPEEAVWEDSGWGWEKAGEWRISPKTLQTFINEAKKNDMEFYTTSEIAGVATFIDRNLEKCIREHISNPIEPWVKISDLSSIKELDLSNKNISNLDGLQYLVNLEKINLSNNNIADLRLLKKLPKLKDINL
ncbi:polysaccharide deacetylase family protein [Paenibacillus sp. 2RAB27]|uniref:polysaccharide deacetylase family protein n=1 Tax=Paenibacillus sp. 2RAB27 TaxID=3232991 RepID=UPI003F9B6439